MHLIDRIGPYLGVAAFLGLSVLAVLVFLEAREVRRLREWAGRAPERALEAADATAAASEARGEGAPRSRGLLARIVAWFAALGDAIAERVRPAYSELDRRSPIDPRILIVALVAAIVAAGILTGGFGLGGGGASKHPAKPIAAPAQTKVAVLNGSQQQGVAGVPGLAGAVLNQVVKPAGYRTGKVADAPTPFAKSTVLFAHGQAREAKALAAAVKPKLGTTKIQAMSSDVGSLVGKTPLALIIGADDTSFGSPSGP